MLRAILNPSLRRSAQIGNSRRPFATLPTRFNFSRDILDVQGEKFPNSIAFHRVDHNRREEKYTYKQLCNDVRKTANLMESIGIHKGDRILVVLPRVYEWWLVTLASIRIGAIISPGTTQLTRRDLHDRIAASNAVCVIAKDDVLAKVLGTELSPLLVRIGSESNNANSEKQPSKVQSFDSLFLEASNQHDAVDSLASEPSMLFFTSGTTGKPKMVLHSHSSYGIGLKNTAEHWLGLKHGDLHWNMSDTGWAKALWSSFFAPFIQGATVFVHDSKGFNPAETLDVLSSFKITSFCAAPTIYRLLVQQNLANYDLTSLKSCVGAGEPLNPEVIEKWRDSTKGLVIRDGYGQTETCLLIGSFDSQTPRFGSMGKASAGYDIQLLDNDGNILGDGIEGNIAVRVKPTRPVGIFTEYWKNPQQNEAAFVGDFYLTGDRAVRDSEGYFWFVGRSDDVIITSGYRVGPFEVESALIEHPAVVESAVVATPDEKRGQVVTAFIVLHPDFKPTEHLKTELQTYVKQVTAPYKYPRRIKFVNSLPKTISGKIRRVLLREEYRRWVD